MFGGYVRRMTVVLSAVVLVSAVSVFPAPKKVPEPDIQAQSLAAMKKASAFMRDTVSTRGGFVWNYSADLSERWGEIPARPTQIWVQGATNGVGEMFLDAFRATGDSLYLAYAKRWQMPSSGASIPPGDGITSSIST